MAFVLALALCAPGLAQEPASTVRKVPSTLELAPSGSSTLPAPAAPAPTVVGGRKGLVVRFDTAMETVATPVVVHLQAPDGSTTDLQLRDDGQAPDVAAGDGVWSVSDMVTADEFEVSLSLGGTRHPGGPVSWAGDGPRDLSLAMVGGALRAEVGAGTPPQSGKNAASTTATPTAGPTPTAGGGIPTAGPGPGALPSQPAGGGWGPYVLVGLGGLVLGLVGYLWFRGGALPGALPAGIARCPPLGLAGPSTPPPGVAPQVWVAPEADARALLRVLLATLARRGPVLVAAPAPAGLPAVAGAPVFRVDAATPGALVDALDALDAPTRPVLVLLLADGLGAEAVGAHAAALPEGRAPVVLATESATAPSATVRARREGAGWVLQVGAEEVHAAEGPDGFL